jgi:hypothetical protein
MGHRDNQAPVLVGNDETPPVADPHDRRGERGNFGHQFGPPPQDGQPGRPQGYATTFNMSPPIGTIS